MANEKFEATQLIMNKIDKSAKFEMDALDDKYLQETTSILSEKEALLRQEQTSLIDETKRKLNQEWTKEKSTTDLKLKKRRLAVIVDLYDAFNQELEDAINAYRSTPEYKAYILDKISGISNIEKILLDINDKALNIEGATYIDMPLGGVIIETSRTVYDDSFKKKLSDRLKSLQKEVDIGGSLYE